MPYRVNIFSPRWGHDDPWTFTHHPDGWEITAGAHRARTNASGDDLPGREGGYNMARLATNDEIYIPESTGHFLDILWTAIEDREISEVDAQAAFQELAEWINSTTHNFPRNGTLARFA
ncbi:MAG: hypothetical protein ACTS27_07560 [Phycisphaerales bacterium]